MEAGGRLALDGGLEMSEKARQRAESVLHRLKLRDDARKDKIMAKDGCAVAKHQGEAIYEAWKAKQRDLEAEIRTQGGVEGQSARLDQLGARVLDLEQEAAVASSRVTTYHTEQMSTALNSLRQEFEACRAVVKPKKSFAFSTALQPARAEFDDEAAGKLEGCTALAPPKTSTEPKLAPERVSKGLSGSKISVSCAELDDNGYSLEDLQHCTIRLIGKLSALRARNLSHCTLIAGPVAGAAFLDGLSQCKLLLAAGQLRLHSSADVDIHLRVRSQPVIEDCKELRFAPLHVPAGHVAFVERLADVGLAEENGNWKKVQDFQWLRASPSPHWSVMEEVQRNCDELWHET